MLYTEVRFLKQVSYRLNRFKLKKDNGNEFLANCKCPYCETDTEGKKARGYFLANKGKLYYYCHNCNVSETFSKWLRQFDHNVWSEYKVEMFKDSPVDLTVSLFPAIPQEKKESIVPDIFHGLTAISALPITHPARVMIEKRKIPQRFLDDSYYVPKFFEWTKGHTKKFEGMMVKDHPRWVIPWYDEDGKLFAYQARAFGPEKPKYYTVILNKSKPKFYGMERLDKTKRIYVVEGPIDSMFLDNAVAIGDAALYRFDDSDYDVTYIPDCENRNREILKVYSKIIDRGSEICMLPASWKYKDINEAIQAGLTSAEIQRIIDENTYNGLAAKVHFSQWRKVDLQEKS